MHVDEDSLHASTIDYVYRVYMIPVNERECSCLIEAFAFDPDKEAWVLRAHSVKVGLNCHALQISRENNRTIWTPLALQPKTRSFVGIKVCSVCNVKPRLHDATFVEQH